MSAQIDSEHLLLERQLHLLCVLPDLRHTDVKLLLLGVIRYVEEGHLPRKVALFILDDMVEYLNIHAHELLSRSAKAVERACLDKVLNCTPVEILVCHSRNEVLQVRKRPAPSSLCDNCLNHRSADTLDRRQCIAHLAVGDREATLPLINVGR